ncbi:DUF6878 family protein (plasmid) [Burkholderia cenocepacia]|uniref:DUF6878 family protein n=1 Tax=Burkholderia cenocepacia TaxID=95486 RepID=UPI00209F15EE|nr:DUF6878 family protein [Burkholderia cenocepacia]MCO8402843.1 hypothetical protein [Burkholderia cenocepacia]MCO8415082.1 hypothetical protein [Burkholderia cenocepacia]MCO8423119.1 hypothetical protein [Burkholderia cenocepacia]MCO8474829.1 hypothetical protein [Burkholderia cenocepacia]MCO8481991.1 hypothetical protein [Burkholderia cenocepacia]
MANLSSIIPFAILTDSSNQGDALARENVARNKAILLGLLKAAGARSAVVQYSGYGDDGSVIGVQIFGADTMPMSILGDVQIHDHDTRYENAQWTYSPVVHVLPVDDAMTRLADLVVALHHAGYQDGDGGAGELNFDVESGRVWLDHRDYYTESIVTETEL